jgi:hypothetical protein
MTKKWIYGAVYAAVVVTSGLVFAGCSKSPEKPQAQLEAAEQKVEATGAKTEASSGKETAETTGAPKDAAPQFTPESDFKVSLTADSEGIVIKKYAGKGRAIVIPPTIQGFPVREIADYAFYIVDDRGEVLGKDIQTVVIPAGVTNIGALAFMFDKNLYFVDVPAGVKSIGSNAFSSTGLTTVTIYAGTTYGSNVYSSCEALKTVTIQDGVTVIPDSLFSGCTSLTTISIPDSVVEIEDDAFGGCANLSTVTFSPDIKRKWGDWMDNVFENCPKIPLATQAALRKAGYTGSF